MVSIYVLVIATNELFVGAISNRPILPINFSATICSPFVTSINQYIGATPFTFPHREGGNRRLSEGFPLLITIPLPFQNTQSAL